jgi:hypothetical protein
MPDDATIEKAITPTDASASRQAARRADRRAYAGPAIIMNRACGVFFHEIFGHRIEGHRQKDVEEGQTFTKKVEHVDHARRSSRCTTTQRSRSSAAIFLNGRFQYDDEGVAAQRVTLVDKGILKNFLMSRSPIANFPTSNGHGRCAPGYPPVSRQGNAVRRVVAQRVARSLACARCCSRRSRSRTSRTADLPRHLGRLHDDAALGAAGVQGHPALRRARLSGRTRGRGRARRRLGRHARSSSITRSSRPDDDACSTVCVAPNRAGCRCPRSRRRCWSPRSRSRRSRRVRNVRRCCRRRCTIRPRTGTEGTRRNHP